MLRILNAKPTEIELFAPRLLVHVKGPQSFLDLKALPSMMVCATFHEVVQMKGLLNFEKEWEYIMTEGAVWHVPTQLRDMFLSILVYNLGWQNTQILFLNVLKYVVSPTLGILYTYFNVSFPPKRHRTHTHKFTQNVL